MSWTGSNGFLASESVEKNINGKMIKFYALPMGVCFNLKKLAKPFGKSVMEFLDNGGSNDFKQENRSLETEDGVESVFTTEARPLEVIKYRAECKSKALEDLIDMVLGNEELIVQMICRSMRDIFPSKRDVVPAEEFMENVSIDVFFDMIMGVVEANKKILGPFSDTLTQAIKSKMPQSVEDQEVIAPQTELKVEQ